MFEDAVNAGPEFTVTLLTAPARLTHPCESVPVTVKEVEAVGVTTADPPLYVYVEAPEGVIVNDCPLQIVPLLAVIVSEVTLTLIVLLSLQPLRYPVTVYVALAVGLTAMVFVACPVLQL